MSCCTVWQHVTRGAWIPWNDRVVACLRCRAKRELEACRERLFRLALPWNTTASFTLTESQRGQVLLRIRQVRSLRPSIPCMRWTSLAIVSVPAFPAMWQGHGKTEALPLVFGQRAVERGLQCVGPVQAELFICRCATVMPPGAASMALSTWQSL